MLHLVRSCEGTCCSNLSKAVNAVALTSFCALLSCAVMQSLFMSMDKDNDGRLSAADLHRAIKQVGALHTLLHWS
jgi:hypothetical protein